MVDSSPTGAGPPSTISSMRPRRSASTCAAVVGETWPERLADGATTGPPNAARMARATGWSGTRTPMVSRPAVASCGDRTIRDAFGSTSVSGPGQNAPTGARPRRRTAPSRRARAGVGHVRDQRIERGPALGRIEPGDRLAVGRVGAEPIDGLGRKRDEPAGRQHAGGALDRRRASLDHLRCRRPRSCRLPCFGFPAVAFCCPASVLAARMGRGYKTALFSRSVAQSGSAPRSGRGGRRFKSCHSDQYLA